MSAGQAGDAPEADGLLCDIETQAVIADRAYDTDAILEVINAQGAVAVIPAKANRKIKRDTNWSRHKIEVMVGFMKRARRGFARFDELARRSLAFVHFGAACILLR